MYWDNFHPPQQAIAIWRWNKLWNCWRWRCNLAPSVLSYPPGNEVDDDAADANDGVVDHDVDDDGGGDTDDDGDDDYKIRVFRSRFCLPLLNVGEKVSCLSLSYVPPRRISKYPDQIEAIHNEFQGRFKSRRLHKPPIPVGLPFFFVIKVSLF